MRVSLLFLPLLICGTVMAQTVSEQYILDVSPQVYEEFEATGYADLTAFQIKSYMQVPDVFDILPATTVRGASGFPALVDGASQTSVIYALSTIDEVSAPIPYVLIGSVTAELQWYPLVSSTSVEITVSGGGGSGSGDIILELIADPFVGDSTLFLSQEPVDGTVQLSWQVRSNLTIPIADDAFVESGSQAVYFPSPPPDSDRLGDSLNAKIYASYIPQ